MPTLWPHLLKALTPPRHQVSTMDGNVVRLSPEELTVYVEREKVDLVSIGGIGRNIHRPYAVADRLLARGGPFSFSPTTSPSTRHGPRRCCRR